jgi:mannose-6-phosphate isomerase-like protein (cupin superfamily)
LLKILRSLPKKIVITDVSSIRESIFDWWSCPWSQERKSENHEDADQFFRVEKGKGEVWIDGSRTKIKGDDAIAVPAGD